MEETEKINIENGDSINRLSKILYALAIIAITITGYLNEESLFGILKLNILTILLVSITIFYAKDNNIKINKHRTNVYMMIGAFLFSLLCVMISVKFNIYNLWLVGPMLIAMLIDMNFGLSFHLLFSFMLSVTADFSIDNLLFNFILGALGCILAKYIKESAKAGYALIIFLSSNITLIFIMNNFMTKKSLDFNVLYSVLSSLLVFAINYAFYQIFIRFVKDDATLYHEITEKLMNRELNQELNQEMNQKLNHESIRESNQKWNQDTNTKTNQELNNTNNIEIINESKLSGLTQKQLDVFMKEDFGLVTRLKDYSEKLYQRSLYISEVSSLAAKTIQANADLARVGGFYCKIGRIVSKNYIEDGVQLLEQYHFPNELIDIIDQHNSQRKNPTSKEAAIVMLTDSIISSMEMVKNMKETKPIPTNKLIDGIFSLRLSKSNLDESTLTITNLKQLKEFYMEELPNISKKYEDDCTEHIL